MREEYLRQALQKLQMADDYLSVNEEGKAQICTMQAQVYATLAGLPQTCPNCRYSAYSWGSASSPEGRWEGLV